MVPAACQTARAPHSRPHKLADDIAEALIHALRGHPDWGARKLLRWLAKQQPALPGAIRTDNGVPFATTSVAGLSKLSVYWLKLGIAHQRIAPGRPEQNGRHERMHRTLKARTTQPAEADMGAQQARFDAFRREYNDERPHEALEMLVPSSVYQASGRVLPAQLPEPCYPSRMQVRWVSNAGTFRFKRHQVFLCRPLIHEYIALEETADGIWTIYFYDTVIARLDKRDGRVFS